MEPKISNSKWYLLINKDKVKFIEKFSIKKIKL